MNEQHSKRELILEYYGYHDDEGILFADTFDSAIIGIDPVSMRVIYSRNLALDGLVEDGMDIEEAAEFLEYNTFSAWVGPRTPIWVEDFNWNLEW